LVAVSSAAQSQVDKRTSAEAQEVYSDIPLSYARTVSLKEHFRALTRDVSARHAIAYAEKLTRAGLLDDCHLASHSIGAVVLAASGNVGATIGACSMGCSQGCFRGSGNAQLFFSSMECCG
jgi:hypothetical protein